MTLDYPSLGFKAGIEIHNRLATKHKLFCNCPAKPLPPGVQPSALLRRKLRTVPGELGEVDPAALYEFLRGKTFVYQVYPSTCEVEADEEPPRPLNPEALELGLAVAMMLKCTTPDEVHVMRKTVIDGSNTSGFQRTALVGTDGLLITNQGPVRITNVCVEEESAGIVQQKDGEIVYRLDRLGIPLIEIGTAADVKSPEHAREIAEKLGMLIRSTGKSQRGIGSIRQDVNVSIAKGARVEIKGVQELELIEKVIETEVRRQLGLLKLKEELIARNAVVSDVVDVTQTFSATRNKMISSQIAAGGRVYAIGMSGWAGLLEYEICPGLRFGAELADIAKSYGVKGLIHSDENISGYGLEAEFAELLSKMKAGPQDALLIIAGKAEAEAAIEAVRDRCLLAAKEIPSETRAANADGTTRYMRPLPGAARMYPETDVPPIPLTKEIIAQIKLPETWDVKRARYSKILSADLVDTVLRSEWLDLFEMFAKSYDPVLVATTLTSTLKDLRRRGHPIEVLTEQHLSDTFKAVKQGVIAKEAIPVVLERLTHEPNLMVIEAIAKAGLGSMSDAELRHIIRDVFAKYPNLVSERRASALMGEIMARVRGRVDGKKVAAMLEAELAMT
ncbi:MAG: Glu-tRNA(Gln) amidotransferase subunit GatE [Candidatus Aenigmatarchaeota archaeon]|nr:Glu-tRNA(Gln) amidotransferase subunit GatE [Candidatus Aenigmarchaeota archaeon]